MPSVIQLYKAKFVDGWYYTPNFQVFLATSSSYPFVIGIQVASTTVLYK